MIDARRLLASAGLTALVVAGVSIIALLATLPDPAEFRNRWPESTAYMRIRAGEAAADGRRFRLRYTPVALALIPEVLQRAIRVAEDAAFFEHEGFDWYEVRQAVSEAWEDRRAPRGASTISQQLARNLYLSPDRDFLRKTREALITERLEARLSKRRIFELYLNVIEFGDGVFGVEAAARHYFGVPAAEVSPIQAAQLAATIPAPRRQNPSSDTRAFQWRTKLVYQRAFARSDTVADHGVSAVARPNGAAPGRPPERGADDSAAAVP